MIFFDLWLPGSFPTDRSNVFFSVAVLLCASVFTHVAFVSSLFVPHLSCWCLVKAVLRDCGISWVSSLICSCTACLGSCALLLVSLVGYVLWQWVLLDIFFLFHFYIHTYWRRDNSVISIHVSTGKYSLTVFLLSVWQKFSGNLKSLSSFWSI